MARLSGSPKFKVFDPNNNYQPAAGGKIYTYEMDGTTPQTTYKLENESQTNTNPIILDENGECDLFYALNTYVIQVKDSSDNLIWTSPIFNPSDNTFGDLLTPEGELVTGNIIRVTGSLTILGTASASGKLILKENTGSGTKSINLSTGALLNSNYTVKFPTTFTEDYYLKVNNITDSVITLDSDDPTPAPASALFCPNYIDGCLMSNAADANNDITIGTGQAADSSNTSYIYNNSTITKQLDVTWSQGTNAGGRATSVSLTNNTSYHVFLLLKNDGTTVDAGFDTSITATNLLAAATNYTKYRRVGSIYYFGGIYPFTAGPNGLIVYTIEANAGSRGYAGTLNSIASMSLTQAPPGIKSKVNFTISAGNYVYKLYVYDGLESGTNGPLSYAQGRRGTYDNPGGYRACNLTGSVNAYNRVIYTQGQSPNDSNSFTATFSVTSYIDPRGTDGGY